MAREFDVFEDDLEAVENVFEMLGLGLSYDEAPEWLLQLARAILKGKAKLSRLLEAEEADVDE